MVPVGVDFKLPFAMALFVQATIEKNPPETRFARRASMSLKAWEAARRCGTRELRPVKNMFSCSSCTLYLNLRHNDFLGYIQGSFAIVVSFLIAT